MITKERTHQLAPVQSSLPVSPNTNDTIFTRNVKSVSVSNRESLEVVIQKYVQDRRHVRSSLTLDRHARTLRLFMEYMGVRYTEEITTDSVMEWGQAKINHGISPSTVFADFNAIRAFLSYLEHEGIKHGAERKKLYCRPSYKPRRALRASDVALIAYMAPYEINLLIRLVFCTGMRISEALAVKADDIQIDNSIRFIGKGYKEGVVFVWPELAKELRDLANGTYCFRNKDGGMLDRKSALVRFKQAATKAGYPWAHYHTLRHSYATELLRGGSSLEHVRRLMRHSSIESTQPYIHLVTEDIQESHQKHLPKVLDSRALS